MADPFKKERLAIELILRALEIAGDWIEGQPDRDAMGAMKILIGARYAP